MTGPRETRPRESGLRETGLRETGPREGQVIEAFVSLSRALVTGYDVVDLLDGLTGDCARLLDVASAGLLLADGRGVLHVLAASSQRTQDLEVFQLQRGDGPCLDCYSGGEPVSSADLEREAGRWPQFVPAARVAGFASVHALRLGNITLGALGLFGTSVGALNAEDLALGQLWPTSPVSPWCRTRQPPTGARSPNSCRACWPPGSRSSRPRGCSPKKAAWTWSRR